MNRRTFIASAGGIAAAGTGLALFGGSVAASEDVETGWFAVEDYSIDSQSGRLTELNVDDITVIAEWENFDHTAHTVEFDLDVTVDGRTKHGGSTTVGVEKDDFGETDYEGSVVGGIESFDLVELFGAEAFETPSDHGDSDYESDVTKEHGVQFSLTATVFDDGGNDVDDTVTGESLVNVTNLGADVVAGGNAEFDGKEEKTYDPEPVETMDGIKVVKILPGKVTLKNTNDFDAIVTVKWFLFGERQYFLEAGETATFTPLSEEYGGQSMSIQSADGDTDLDADDAAEDEFEEIVDVEEA